MWLTWCSVENFFRDMKNFSCRPTMVRWTKAQANSYRIIIEYQQVTFFNFHFRNNAFSHSLLPVYRYRRLEKPFCAPETLLRYFRNKQGRSIYSVLSAQIPQAETGFRIRIRRPSIASSLSSLLLYTGPSGKYTVCIFFRSRINSFTVGSRYTFQIKLCSYTVKRWVFWKLVCYHKYALPLLLFYDRSQQNK